MSELIATSSGEIRARDALLGYWWYEKSEADKVIAELKADYNEACDRLQTANLIKDEQLAETRHQKYKRCLAMAKQCGSSAQLAWDHDFSFYNNQYAKMALFFEKWRKRWLKIAEKFKEAK